MFDSLVRTLVLKLTGIQTEGEILSRFLQKHQSITAAEMQQESSTNFLTVTCGVMTVQSC